MSGQPKKMGIIVEHSGGETLNEALADEIAKHLRSLVNEFGEAVLMVSGGSTPGKMYELLSKKEIEWHKIKVTLADERWVDQDSDFSNEKLIRHKLLINRATSACFSGLVINSLDEKLNLSIVRDKYVAYPLEKSVIVLGMGADGHFASLFPDDKFSLEGLRRNSSDLISTHSPTDPHQRISWSLNAISRSPFVFLMITGAQKKQIVLSRRKEKLPVDYLLESIPQLKIMYSE